MSIGAFAMLLGAIIMIYRWNAGIIPEVSIEDQEDMDLARA